MILMFENIPWSVIVIAALYISGFIKDLRWASEGGTKRTYSASVCAMAAIVEFILVFWLYYDFVIMREYLLMQR